MKNIMQYKGFVGSVHFSAEDRVFYGKVEGIEDLITFEGSSVDDLESGFHYMVEEHINDCMKEKKALKRSYKGNLNIRLSPELHKQAAQIAMFKGLSLNQYINEALKKEIASEKI